MQTKRTNILLIIACLTVFLTACSQMGKKDQKAAENQEVQNLEQTEKGSQFGMPSQNGVFMVKNGSLNEIAAGDAAHLMPTNAERGFGFEQPLGIMEMSGISDFSILSSSLDVSQLQITAFTGIAVSTDHWFDAVSNTNVAWISDHAPQMHLRVIDEKSGFAEIHLDSPLEPGFYVLHDDSFLRARQSDDVSAYYPFVVTDSDNVSVWQSDADKCFGQLFDKYTDVLTIGDANELDIKQLKKCVNAQRIAWKYIQNDEARANEQRKRTVYLSRLLDSSDMTTHQAMMREMDSEGDEISLSLWKIEQYDLMQKLSRLYELSTSGGDLPPLLLNSVLESYEPALSEKKAADIEGLDSGSSNESLSALLWLPFVYLSDDDPTREAYFEAVINSEPIESSQIEIAGAIQYQRLFTFVQKNKKLASWLKQIDATIPAAFRTRASTLSFRKEFAKVIIGPFNFQGVVPVEYSSWKATFRTMEKSVRACIPADYHGQNMTLILEQPLNGATPGRDLRGVLRDPVASQRKVPVISPEMVNCMLNVFAKIPSEPALDTTQKAIVAVTVYVN